MMYPEIEVYEGVRVLTVEGTVSGEIKIYDFTGSLLISTNEKEIDVSYLIPGIYLLKAENSEFKFIKTSK